jgi:hypothetical protein
MSDISKCIDAIIRGGLAIELKSDGYKKTARTFHCREQNSVKVVNVQASQCNIGGEDKFTMNLGVYLPLVEEKLKRRNLTGGPPKEYECTTRLRIGELLPGEQDHWWVVSEQTDLASLAADVRQAWLTLGKAWFDQPWGDPLAVGELLEKRHNYLEAAAAYVLIGEVAKAEKVLQHAVRWHRANGNANAADWVLNSAHELGVKLDG